MTKVCECVQMMFVRLYYQVASYKDDEEQRLRSGNRKMKPQCDGWSSRSNFSKKNMFADFVVPRDWRNLHDYVWSIQLKKWPEKSDTNLNRKVERNQLKVRLIIKHPLKLSHLSRISSCFATHRILRAILSEPDLRQWTPWSPISSISPWEGGASSNFEMGGANKIRSPAEISVVCGRSSSELTSRSTRTVALCSCLP